MSWDKLLSLRLLLGVLLCFAASPAHSQTPAYISMGDSSGWGTSSERQLNEEDPVMKALPNPDVPAFHLPLKCSACGAIVEHAVHLLSSVVQQHLARREREARGGGNPPHRSQPKQFEMVDAFEQLCREVPFLYGLEMISDTEPSLFFSKSNMINRVRGGWMQYFLASTCEELLDEQEEELVAAIFAAADEGGMKDIPRKVREVVCTQWERSSKGCDAHGMPITRRPSEPSDL
ncbi:hypothetical protein TraAM80_00294 [Trypanosoma rangeli]|uniref:DUF3456 domain-containing protein n=1 Tax=Trypanosoma rangeli TaxID=5698 RepID=A0A3R7NVH0_TRYRA|nr:uncharacterized protein TraAM80_00294 [Trypanosoma rangeli]RNF12442.1 hypothetical protein TraAM80_00294 [Trypanosoma rangeli]|eukprot:RNF12442.1 hypothetical protein TraAM80_00294 [Trypanosoma rangeli]